MTTPILYRVKPLFQQLGTLGLAVDYHPHYVNKRIAQHTVDVVLISYIARGMATHFLDEESFVEGPGCLTITHHNQAHDIVTDRRGIAVYNLFVDLNRYPLPQMPESLQGILPQVLPLNPTFRHHKNRRIRLQFSDADSINALFRAMHQESVDHAPGADEMLHLLFRALLIRCCRWASEHGITPLSTPASEDEKQIEELRRLLEKHPTEPHTLEGLAERVGWSRNLLCRHFETCVGKSLLTYLLELRVQNAMVRLRHNDDKILTVAEDTGFKSVAQFNRSFRKFVGVSPAEYRRQTRNSYPST